MTHIRTTIRNEIVTQLINASITGVGSDVFPTRFKPIPKDDVPIITVYTLLEDVVDNSKAVRFDRELSIAIEAYDREDASEAVDEKLDNISQEIEDALKNFKPQCKTMDLEKTEVNVDPDGEKTAGSIRLTYLVRYATFRGD